MRISSIILKLTKGSIELVTEQDKPLLIRKSPIGNQLNNFFRSEKKNGFSFCEKHL